MPKKVTTSWNKSADWYDDLLAGEDTYQRQVILPNLLRLMDIQKGESVLELGCGTGFFCHEFEKAGAKVTGIDLGADLIEIAKKNVPTGEFYVASAESLPAVSSESADKVVFILSLQNMSKMAGAIAEAARVVKEKGRMFFVLNHPAFRIPGASSWGWDERAKTQYRRLDSYLSEKKSKIFMHPGQSASEVTWSFHAPLQYYFKAFQKNQLAVERLEEWVSHKKTHEGPRAEAENRSRAEFPLFMALVARKV
jgi:ubiquinone/menaquinone biosynthesis C-methylase UbiE